MPVCFSATVAYSTVLAPQNSVSIQYCINSNKPYDRNGQAEAWYYRGGFFFLTNALGSVAIVWSPDVCYDRHVFDQNEFAKSFAHLC